MFRSIANTGRLPERQRRPSAQHVTGYNRALKDEPEEQPDAPAALKL